MRADQCTRQLAGRLPRRIDVALELHSRLMSAHDRASKVLASVTW
jgi:hypothetical protein